MKFKLTGVYLKNCKQIYLLLSICLFVLLLTACTRQPRANTPSVGDEGGSSSAIENNQTQDLLSVGSVYIAPVMAGVGVNLDATTAQMLTASLERGIREQMELEVTKATKNTGPLDFALVGQAESIEQAQKLDADTVVFARVDRYIDRTGSRVGSGQGAEVAMTITLMRVSDQHKIWTRSFGYKDQAWSDNILKFGDRQQQQHQADTAGWLSAEQLWNNGVREVVQALRQERLQAFQG